MQRKISHDSESPKLCNLVTKTEHHIQIAEQMNLLVSSMPRGLQSFSISAFIRSKSARLL